MDDKQEFLKLLLETFRIEADEGIKKILANLLKLEKDPQEPDKSSLIEVVFREAHSLKGASRAVNLQEIESVCQAFESVMSGLKSKTLEFNPITFDVLYQAIDIIEEILDSTENDLGTEIRNSVKKIIVNLSLIERGKSSEIEGVEKSPKSDINPSEEKLAESTDHLEFDPIKRENESPIETPLKDIVESENTIAKDKIPQKVNPANETIRVSTEKLDKILFLSEEMMSIKLANVQQIENLNSAISKIQNWNKEFSNLSSSLQEVRQNLDSKEHKESLSREETDILKLAQFSEWSKSYITSIEESLVDSRKFSRLEADVSSLKIETLLDQVKTIITIPLSNLLDSFPKLVRDVSKDLGKESEFITEGGDIEVDRRILESMRHPLMHIIRNSLDYGIEKPEARQKMGKSPKGTIKVSAERLENNKIRVQISDDGAGINLEKLRDLYAKNEGISAKEAKKIQDKELMYTIFRSGVSTSKMVTDISGRGLGLAIVQEKIEELGGSIILESVKNKGTSFILEIPLTLISFKGIIVNISGNQFIIPNSKVERALRINKKEVKTVENRDTILYEERVIPMVHISDILELPYKKTESDYFTVLIVNSRGENIGFVINEIIGESEILVKSFNKPLERLRNISGASVLGSGKVLPILNVYDLIKSANNPGKTRSIEKSEEETETIKKALVVEDSITSRTLLKNILESAGYIVTTAIDGIDGYTKLKENSYDAVISDIEMPRMDGFELTAKIRADKELSELPVVLVSSLSKPEHREKGIEVGANAYIIKSSFDQSNLLEVLERLI